MTPLRALMHISSGASMSAPDGLYRSGDPVADSLEADDDRRTHCAYRLGGDPPAAWAPPNAEAPVEERGALVSAHDRDHPSAGRRCSRYAPVLPDQSEASSPSGATIVAPDGPTQRAFSLN
jgi:hypothetical protein